MLDPVLQSELKKASRTVVFVHIAMLGEPFVYMIIALALKQADGFEGTEGSQSVVPLLRTIFMLVSAAVVLSVIILRRLLFSPERLVPPGTDAKKIAMTYSRAQMIIDALATVPATLGLVLFFLDGRMEPLVALSAVSIAMLVFMFPRYDALEEAVLAGIARGEAIRPAEGEFDENA